MIYECLECQRPMRLQSVTAAGVAVCHCPRCGKTEDRFDHRPTTVAPDPRVRKIDPLNGRPQISIQLSQDERDDGFVRPVRLSYRHLACGDMTTMAAEVAETYARAPAFYSRTYCATCRDDFPTGELRSDFGDGSRGRGEFVWLDDGSAVGA